MALARRGGLAPAGVVWRAVAWALLASLLGAVGPPALASHFRGGNIYVEIDAAGVVQLHVATRWRKEATPSPAGVDPGRFGLTSLICAADGSTVTFPEPVGLRIQRASDGATVFAFPPFAFDMDATTVAIDTTGPSFDERVQRIVIPLGSAPDPDQVVPPLNLPGGPYEILWTDFARVQGIQNLEPAAPCPTANSEFGLRVRVPHDGFAMASPRFQSLEGGDVIAVRGRDFSANLNAVDPDGDPIFYRLVVGDAGSPDYGPLTQVPGLTLDPFGEVRIPAASTAALLDNGQGEAGADYVIKVQAEDSRGISERDILLDVRTTADTPPTVEPIGDRVVRVGRPVAFEVRATDDPGDVLFFPEPELPAGAVFAPAAQFAPAAHTFSWVPVPADAGKRVKILFEVQDGEGLRGSRPVELVVVAGDRPPVFEWIPNRQVGADPADLVPFVEETLTFDVRADDDLGDVIYSAPIFVDPAGTNRAPGTPGDAGGTITNLIDPFGDRIGRFTWAPQAADVGSWNLRLRVDDGAGNRDEAFVTISVGTFTNQPPVFVTPPPPPVTLFEGQTHAITVEARDDLDVEEVTLYTAGRPAGSVFPEGATSGPGDLTSGMFTWTPPPGASRTSPYRYRVQAVDQRGNRSVSASVEVYVERDAPPSVTLHVRKATGTDAPCTFSREDNPAEPFFTIQGAFDCLRSLHGGDISAAGPFRIQVDDSEVYAETLVLDGLTTAPGAGLTVVAADEERPAIDGGGIRNVGVDVRIDHVTLDGLTLRNLRPSSPAAAIQIDGNHGLTVRRCTIEGFDFGILIGFRVMGAIQQPVTDVSIHNNVLTIFGATDPENGGDAIHVMGGVSGLRIHNNTFYRYPRSAIHVMGESATQDVDVRNNIFHPGLPGPSAIEVLNPSGTFSSDYNAFSYLPVGRWALTPAGSLAEWQAVSGQDLNSFVADPQLVDPDGGDFHLRSTAGRWQGGALVLDGVDSLCIDAGDPAMPYALERENNGDRVNIGAYGNTAEASLTGGCTDNDGDNWASCAGDCNDFDPLSCPDPGACPELCDAVDNDCDGAIDESVVDCSDGDSCNGLEICQPGGACTAGAPPAGEVPDGASAPGPQLLVDLLPGGEVMVSYGASCNACDTDYAVYEGSLGDYASHVPRLCSTGGALAVTFVPDPGNRYFLSVPLGAGGLTEGSYGRRGDGAERPAGVPSCAPRLLGGCAGAPGSACTGGAECGTGLCVDGFCCNRACDACEACNRPGFEGICTPVDPGSGPAESCDGADNDCDGMVDEGFSLGEACTGTGACGGGVVECATPGATRCSSSPGGSADQSQPERCDGLDNDCDGMVDEGFALGAACVGSGVCGGGVVECAPSGGARCSSEPGGSADQSQAERCDGRDDDCDGLVDEDFSLGEPCVGPGACGGGIFECRPDGSGGCSTSPGGSQDGSSPERCDGLDNDCQGDVDEVCACQPSSEQACGPSAGACAPGGLQECLPFAGWGPCTAPPPAEERCDGVDDDCDGEVDEGFSLGEPCVGSGVCGGGVHECDGAGGGRCSSEPGGSQDRSSMESCNGLDDDCDGAFDETCSCAPGETRTCGTGVGECAAGTLLCVQSYAWVCTSPQAEPERCDGLDNDCDGLVDEEFAAQDASCGQGECRVVGTCAGGTIACTPLDPAAEQCDGLDNDCDGVADNGFGVGAPCDGQGACGDGVVECAGPSALRCSSDPGGSRSQSLPEACDGQDNDCDGLVDEDFGAGAPCDGADADLCLEGIVACVGGVPACSDATGDAVDVCNGLDDDCDGTTDGPGAEASCSLANAQPVCLAGACAIGSCDPGYGDCNLVGADGCETPIDTDPGNCGACSAVCSANHIAAPSCAAGSCNGVCDAGWADCNADKLADGCESDLTSPATCGGCGTSCDDADACSLDACDAVTGCYSVPLSACAVPACGSGGCGFADTDGDGLNDTWETNGYIDVDCNGRNDPGVDTPLANADVNRPNVYVKYDYMVKQGSLAPCVATPDCPAFETCVASVCQGHSHAPSAGTLALVTGAFAAQNVILTFDPVADVLDHHSVVTPGPPAPGCSGPDAVDFYQIKQAHFPARLEPAYHYAVFVHFSRCESPADCALCPGSPEYGLTGLAERPGNDLIVSFGSYVDAGIPVTDEMMAGVLLHYLGHNFDLGHGGSDDVRQKPNYFSVMNPSYQFGIGMTAAPGPYPTSPIDPSVERRIDYSGVALPALDEAGLNEIAGISGSPPFNTDVTVFYAGSGAVRLYGPSNGSAIDWDFDGNPAEPFSFADINGDGQFNLLNGHRDWGGLRLEFQCNTGFWQD